MPCFDYQRTSSFQAVQERLGVSAPLKNRKAMGDHPIPMVEHEEIETTKMGNTSRWQGLPYPGRT